MVTSSTAPLIVVGLSIAFLWAWAWCGVGASARRMSVRLELAGGDAAGEMFRVVWPLMPLVADIVGREARGLDVLGSCAILVSIFALMTLLAIQSLYLGGLPEWAYPGWMARRYYRTHPQAREAELGSVAGAA